MTVSPSINGGGTQTDAGRKLRVLILGINYSPEPTGNAPYSTSLAEGLAAAGHQVKVITGYPHYPEWRVREGFDGFSMTEEKDGVKLLRLRHFVPEKPNSLSRLHMELSFGVRLLLSRWDRPDVILLVSPALFSSAAALIRARWGVRRPPVAIWVQDLYSRGLEEAHGAGQGTTDVATKFESWVLRTASGVVAIHDRFKKYMIDSLDVDEGGIRVIRNWTHLPPAVPADRDETRRKLRWGPDEVIVLHAGNMGAKQGLENVLEAARISSAEQSPLRFVLMGDGNQRARLEALGRDLPHLRFVDPLPGNEFQAALAAADVLLVNEKPGLSEMAVPSKLTSYFDTGLPVLAATQEDSVTAGEIAASRGGIRVDPANPRALVEAAKTLASDPAEGRKLGENGLRFRREILSESTAIAHYDDFIRSLASTRGR